MPKKWNISGNLSMVNNEKGLKKEKEYWTREEIRLLKSLYSSTDTKEIARNLGRSEMAVIGKARNLWLKKNKWNERKIKELIHLYPGLTNKELAKSFKCSINQIKGRAESLSLKKKELVNGQRRMRID
jgi:DNA-binding CsgD family transcriptional regulator